MKTTINQLEVNYQRMGQGPVLVLLHGWGCDWQIWSPIITQLSEAYQLIILDLPAFGASGVPQKIWNSQDYATFLADFFTEIKVKPYAIIGHSFGGKVGALYTAQLANQTVKKLVLVSTSGLPDKPSTYHQLQMKVLRLVPQRVKSSLSGKLKASLLKATGSASDNYHSTPAQKEILKKIVHENINDHLVRINVPTLLIWGNQDQDTPLHQAQQFQKLIPEAKLEVISGVGHFPFIEQPATFITLVTEFFRHE